MNMYIIYKFKKIISEVKSALPHMSSVEVAICNVRWVYALVQVFI